MNLTTQPAEVRDVIEKARAVENADFAADGRYTPELATALDELHTALRGIEPEQESASQE